MSEDNETYGITEIAFTKTKLPYGWMGNMSAYPVTDSEGKQWRTTEALFQAMRFAEDDPIREDIRFEKSPMGAKLKAKGNKDKMVVEQLSLEDLTNMRYCVRLKIEQHQELKDLLVNSGDIPIYEDVTNRGRKGSNLFWGALKLEDGTWEGENWLGRIWMELRDELRKAVEIERRFLLKRLPNIKFDDSNHIIQKYLTDKDSIKTERVRYTINMNTTDKKYHHTIKRAKSGFTVFEEEVEINRHDFIRYSELSKRGLSKNRFNKIDGDLTWEIDDYIEFNLVVAEVELPSEDYPLELPDFIKDNLICEITSLKDFSNSNLAE